VTPESSAATPEPSGVILEASKVTPETSNAMLELSDVPLERGKDSFPRSVVTVKPSIVTLGRPTSRWIEGKTLSLLLS